MGNKGSSNETHYTYVDNTEKNRREAEEKEARRLANEREKSENEEKMRIQREKQLEEERQREQYQQQRKREDELEEAERMEEEQKRLQLEDELLRRRGELFDYKFGDKTRLDNFLGLQIEDVTKLRIGVFGPTGSGKSCFINTCERAVRKTEKGSAPDSTTGQEGTITLEDYLPEMFFHLVDTRGFFNYSANETVEFENILFGKLQPGDNIDRHADGQASSQDMHQCPEFGQRLHGIIIVVKANDLRLGEGALKDYLKPVRDILRKTGIEPITVVTHRDTLDTEEECKVALDQASVATGSSPSHTFFVWNYNKDKQQRDPEIERMVFDIVHYALMTAERAVKIMKQKEKNRQEDEMMRALEGVSISGQVAPDSADDSVLICIAVEGTTGNRLQGNYQGPPTQLDIWKVILSFKHSFNLFLEYLRVRLGVGIASHEDVGRLLITVTCSSLQILEGQWEDYCSGHLNEVAEQKIVTAQVLEKLHLREVKLKTTIAKEEYQKCKEVFLGSDQPRFPLKNYETVDRTYSTARAQSQQKAQEENDRRMQELRHEMERDRQEALREVQQRTSMEDDEQRRKLDRQKREREERERKRKEEEDMLQLKDAMRNYDFQSCPRIKKESFKDLDVGDIEFIRIALIGPTASGKTNFVGTLQRAIGEPQNAFQQETGKEGTIHLEEYYLQKKIRMVDTRGFFDSDERLMDECLEIMSGRIRPGEEIVRNYDKEGNQEPKAAAKLAPALSKYAHAVIFVLKGNDPRLKDGKYKDTLQKIREHFREDGYAPVTVITYLDRLTDKEDKDEAFDEASWATGASGERTYFIANYVNVDAEQSFEVDRTALDILESALLSAERFIRIRKQREKNEMERKMERKIEAMAGAATKGVESVEQFFVRLEKKKNWTDQGKKKAVLEDLRKKEINTVKALKELWEDIKLDLPLSTGMRIALEEEMKHI